MASGNGTLQLSGLDDTLQLSPPPPPPLPTATKTKTREPAMEVEPPAATTEMGSKQEPKSVFEEEDEEQDAPAQRRLSSRSSFAPIKSSMKALRSLSISSAISNNSNVAPELKSPKSWLRSSMRKSLPAEGSTTNNNSNTKQHHHHHHHHQRGDSSTAATTTNSNVSTVVATAHHRSSKTSSEDYTSERASSASTRPTTPSAGGASPGTSVSGDSLGVVKAGPLQGATLGILKSTRKEGYAVLTTVYLMKFKTRNAALEQFPQLAVAVPGSPDSSNPTVGLGPGSGSGSGGAGAEVQVPLEKVVAVFKDEGTKPSFGIEVWYKDGASGSGSSVQGSSSSSAFFSCLALSLELPDDRDDWMRRIQHAVRHRVRAVSSEEHRHQRAPAHVEHELAQIVEAKHPRLRDAHLDVFPVVPRRPYTRLRGDLGEPVRKGWREASGFYLAFSRNVCLLAQFSRSATGHKVNPSVVQYGLVTLSKVNASLNDERFDLIFRLPLDKPKQLELSSRHHRSIVARLFRADLYLKPAWPLWTRRQVFFVNGETQPMYLPDGDDYGGFKRTLDAFLEGYHCEHVNWKVAWRQGVRYPPEFRLLPPCNRKASYTAHQLLAVFRALRFNDFFKSLSFRGVDFSALSGVYDNSNRLEPTAWLSRTGKRCLTREEFEVVENSSVLFQEIVGLLLPSESVKHIDLSGVLPELPQQLPTERPSSFPLERRGCEIVPPIYLLLKSQQCRFKSIVLSGNHMVSTDVSELCLMKCVAFSRCKLDEAALNQLWDGIHQQRESLEVLKLADNAGRIEATKASKTLLETHRIRCINLAHCLKGDVDGPLFNPWATSLYTEPWRLEELNLSGWKMNSDTISRLVQYLGVDESRCLRQLILNNCGITGEAATSLFSKVGGGRDLHLHLSGNPLEDVSTDWIELIHGNGAPRRLHLDMVQFKREYNFNRLLMAIAHNETIEFLSLAGTGPPGRASSRTSDLLSLLFELNATLRYLDLSGYSGKLEDGHLGWGLSGALGGLLQNTRLRQLRIRYHDLGASADVTELCRVIAANRGLIMLDVRGNNFNHHQFGTLVRALRHNRQLISFPLSAADREYAVGLERRLFVQHLSSASSSSSSAMGGGSSGSGGGRKACLASLTSAGQQSNNMSKAEEGRLDGLLMWLKGHWEAEARKVADTLRRNRDREEIRALEFDAEYLEAWDDEDLPAWLVAKADARDNNNNKGKDMDRSSSLSRRASSAALSPPPTTPLDAVMPGSRPPTTVIVPETTAKGASSPVAVSPVDTPRSSAFAGPASVVSPINSPTPRGSVGAAVPASPQLPKFALTPLPPPPPTLPAAPPPPTPFEPIYNVLDNIMRNYTIEAIEEEDLGAMSVYPSGMLGGGPAQGVETPKDVSEFAEKVAPDEYRRIVADIERAKSVVVVRSGSKAEGNEGKGEDGEAKGERGGDVLKARIKDGERKEGMEGLEQVEGGWI